jgi:transcriptional regulator with XRE-family HTH domain
MSADGPSFLRRRLGRELRQLREARSLLLEDVAAHLGVAPSTLSRIETGKAPTRTSYLTILLDLYGVDDADQRKRLADIAREGQRKSWWSDYEDLITAETGRYLGLEIAAEQVRSWSVLAVPGLLQTADYAEAVVRATRPDLTVSQARRLAAIPQGRQTLARSSGRRLNLIIDEAALLRPIAPPDVMADQMRQLAAATADPSVTVRVVALTTPHPVLSPPFALLSFSDPDDPGLACCAGLGNQPFITQHAEQVSTLHATFAALSRAALSPTDSTDLIRHLSNPLSYAEHRAIR